jgi:hypothetical protein
MPEEIASVALMLASDHGHFVRGQTVVVEEDETICQSFSVILNLKNGRYRLIIRPKSKDHFCYLYPK